MSAARAAVALASDPPDGATLLTAEEVAPMLRLRVDGVYRLARRGELRAVRFSRRVLFTPAQVQAFIDGHTDGAR